MGEELQTQYDCSAVSQLPRITNHDALSSDCLLLVSMPTDGQTYTKHLSKSLSLDIFVDYINDKLQIDELKEIVDGKIDRSAISVESTLSCDVANPYIISSFHYNTISGCSLLTGVQGYRLYSVISNDLCIGSSYKLIYDEMVDHIVLSNEALPELSSSVDMKSIIEDALPDVLSTSMLSNVTITKDGKWIYLHFIINKGEGPELRKVKIQLKNLVPLYEFIDGLSTSYSANANDEESHISVCVDTAYVSSDLHLSNYALSSDVNTTINNLSMNLSIGVSSTISSLTARIDSLEEIVRRLSSLAFVTQE